MPFCDAKKLLLMTEKDHSGVFWPNFVSIMRLISINDISSNLLLCSNEKMYDMPFFIFKMETKCEKIWSSIPLFYWIYLNLILNWINILMKLTPNDAWKKFNLTI